VSSRAPSTSVPPSRPAPGGASAPGEPPAPFNLRSFVERALPIGMLALALVGVPVLIFQPEGLPRMRGLEKELAEVSAENVELRRDVAKLRVSVKDLRDDPAAVERIARDQLGLVRKSEVVFQFGKAR
jgi:cell division protein FtsB